MAATFHENAIMTIQSAPSSSTIRRHLPPFLASNFFKPSRLYALDRRPALSAVLLSKLQYSQHVDFCPLSGPHSCLSHTNPGRCLVKALQSEAVVKDEALVEDAHGLSQVCAVLGTQWGDEGKGKLVDILSSRYDVVARCQVTYEVIPGWKSDISLVRKYEDLPAAARAYVERIETLVGLPIKYIGVGPGREALIIKQ